MFRLQTTGLLWEFIGVTGLQSQNKHTTHELHVDYMTTAVAVSIQWEVGASTLQIIEDIFESKQQGLTW